MLKTPYTPRHYFPSLFPRETVDNKKKLILSLDLKFKLHVP